MSATPTHESVIRMRFELERGDNPPLFDELMKFAKGTKRLNRLRILAHEGLLAQREWITPTGRSERRRDGVPHTAPDSNADAVLSAASNELFGPAIDA